MKAQAIEASAANAATALLLSPGDYKILDEDDFGVPGLVAKEIIGPFVQLQASGPLIMVHDGVFDPYKGIGHHPHQMNERLFYILEGAVDHDDALNGITGHMPAGSMGRLTEGRRGMLHKEWNNTGGRTRAFILVYSTDPVPPTASFELLEDADAPRHGDGPGVISKELVGPRVDFPVNGDIRLFTDTRLDPGARMPLALQPGEGALVVPIEGEVRFADDRLTADDALVLPPEESVREATITSDGGARIMRAVYGPGHGLVLAGG